ETLLENPASNFCLDFDLQLKGERILEVLVQIMLDVCTHIVANSLEPAPESYADCFRRLVSIDVLSETLGEKSVGIVKMRNLVSHQYGIIDYNLLYAGLEELQTIFKEYQQAILSWIEMK
ncbi:MAG TPA: HepT-like ribonuclease domain-containing protein, partial [Candidatus Lokiarchaeia archaeon]|nr:HepT-like ribonuclease domain-containing protein [Candidatus Lokiarchaeia archaeon]